MGGYGLLGERLGHSFSPLLHALLGCPDYDLYEVAPEKLGTFLAETDLNGMNVTIPYKKAVMPYCASLSPQAKRIGSVNTLCRRPEGWFGDNTDYAGFQALVERCGVSVTGKKALVFGSGGASVTACAVLRALGAEPLVISRSGENHYGNLERHRDARLLVNTTPLGMYPQNGTLPAHPADFPLCEAVYDVVYNPARTALLLEAAALGIPHMGGLGMLAAQAFESERLFTGKALPPALCREAEAALGRKTENLILIGMPGCGKSHVGSLLAKALNRPFLDADTELEQAAGRSIPELLAAEGEAAFRQRETAVLVRLGKRSGAVIATGGGCVTTPENEALLRQNGRVFWLKRDIDRLPTAGRPLSRQAGPAALYQARKPLYARFADAAVDNNGLPEETVKEILKQWDTSC